MSEEMTAFHSKATLKANRGLQQQLQDKFQNSQPEVAPKPDFLLHRKYSGLGYLPPATTGFELKWPRLPGGGTSSFRSGVIRHS